MTNNSKPTRNTTARRTPDRRNLERRAPTNQRKAVRYTKDALTAHLILKKLLKANQYTFAKVANISSTGARIDTTQKLPLKAKITLNIMLDNHTVYQTKAKVIRTCQNAVAKDITYGLIFEKTQHALIDHIIAKHHDDTSIE